MFVSDLESIKIKLASSEEVLNWSYGEVTKPETINYRTQRPEKDGLFCEKIFGPTKDYECFCGKYKRIRYKGIICDRCGVEVTKSSVRRERMGHIKLATPVSHIWFLKSIPSKIGMILGISLNKIEEVIYFISYIVTKVDEDAREKILEEIEEEFKSKSKESKNDKETLEKLKESKERAKQEVSSIKRLAVLSEIDYHRLSLKYGEMFEAGTGAEVIKELFKKINLEEEIEKLKAKLQEKKITEEKRNLLRRLKLFQEMKRSGVRPEWMFIDVLPVLPPDLRPMVQLDGGRYASSDLNDLYRRVINRNNRLKYLLEIGAPEVIVRNEKRMLQEAVDALIDNKMRKGTTTQASTGGKRLLKSLSDMLQGKQGRFRQNLLGKRVDYSGRSVIVVGPNLRLDQCGVPKKMALELFKPFVIKKILEKEWAFNVRGASRLIEEETDEIWGCLEEVVKEKLVLLNRAPTLHRLGVQAFYPVLIEGEAIRLHPLVCTAFNADFDGDQMAIHVPLSEEAQAEAKQRMLSSVNLLKPSTGDPIMIPTKDMVLGCYYLTKIVPQAKGEGKIFSSFEDALIAYNLKKIDLRANIKVRKDNEFIETSVGRILFNEVLPEGFEYQNETMDSKNVKKMINRIVDIHGNAAAETLDKIKNLGFKFATKSGITWGMDDLTVPVEKEELIKQAEEKIRVIEDYYEKGLLSRDEKANQVIEVWKKVKNEIEKLVPRAISSTSQVFSIVDSGSRGSWSQPVQMAGMKGLVANPAGRIIELAIKNSFKEGFDVLEYFISTHGARKGTADTALRTSTSGYLTRRLVDVAHDVIITEEDCGDKEGLIMSRKESESINQDFVHKIFGRISMEKIVDPNTNETILKAGEAIDLKKAQKIKELNIPEIKVRSPLTCKCKRGVCQKCYGLDLGWKKMIDMGEAVGVVAAQAIGEPGTQLTMRTFHTGGVAGEADITRGLPRVEEVFERRAPKGEAEICLKDGKVIEADEKKGLIRILPQKDENSKKKAEEAIEYKTSPNIEILVKEGDMVKRGDPLTAGSLDLKKLFKLVGTRSTQKYIIDEIQKVYISQGVSIHDKHVEVIVRQMFSRVKIKDPGDSFFAPEEIVSKAKILEENEELEKQKKNVIEFDDVVLGISKVALNTDSFLSAASFQETSRVLIEASLRGEEDNLRGLKENVIIGKLVPIGTGIKNK
ncbi:MAG TPA: DNA-directed RNA polymerase subunit beta' [Candidatus Pacearchaeota archaeon]|nr:DNA-directed RNA polymerase subunit beta' [Candidatus Pacearchaeota archaeon]HQM24482.1 DNA-directed RNA polymerase subunit beta' [Candidatus Pacearchaeota archaeon]